MHSIGTALTNVSDDQNAPDSYDDAVADEEVPSGGTAQEAE